MSKQVKIVKANKVLSEIVKGKYFSKPQYSVQVELETEEGEKISYTWTRFKKADLKAKIAEIPCGINGMMYEPETGFITMNIYSNGL